MKYCRYCLNHGFRFYMSSDHQINCRLSQCICSQCRTTPPHHYSDHKSVTTIPSEAQIEATHEEEDNEEKAEEEVKGSTSKELGSDDPIGGQSSVNVLEPMTDPLEAIKSFAQKLSESDLSTNDIQNCVLYALLRSNDFSIEETKQELCQSRTAILESLVIPAFDCNRDINLKRSRSASGSSKISTKKPMAKKSFHENRSNQTTDPNISSDLMETTERQSEVLVPKSQNLLRGTSSPTILVCTQTQTSITCVPKSSTNFSVKRTESKPQKLKTVVSKPSVSTAIKPIENNSLNLNQSVSKTNSDSVNKKPIQSVRPQICWSNTSTNVVSTIPSTPITSPSFKPILLKSSKTYSNQKKSINSLQPKITTEVTNSVQNPNQIQIISGSNSIESTTIDQFLSSLAPKIKTYSKIRLTKSECSLNSKDKELCSPVITTEAALVAISALSDTNSVISKSNTDPKQGSDNEMVSQTDSSQSIDMFVTNGVTNISTTYSDQFKMFLNNSKESAISPQKSEPKKESNRSKEIFEIDLTID